MIANVDLRIYLLNYSRAAAEAIWKMGSSRRMRNGSRITSICASSSPQTLERTTGSSSL